MINNNTDCSFELKVACSLYMFQLWIQIFCNPYLIVLMRLFQSELQTILHNFYKVYKAQYYITFDYEKVLIYSFPHKISFLQVLWTENNHLVVLIHIKTSIPKTSLKCLGAPVISVINYCYQCL